MLEVMLNVGYLYHFQLITSKTITLDEIIYACLCTSKLFFPYSFFKSLGSSRRNYLKIFIVRKTRMTENSFSENSYMKTLS